MSRKRRRRVYLSSYHSLFQLSLVVFAAATSSFPTAIRSFSPSPTKYRKQHYHRDSFQTTDVFISNTPCPGENFDDPASLSSSSSSSGASSSNAALSPRGTSAAASLSLRESTSGLSRFHQSILSRTSSARQCFATGRYPLTVSFRDCPTRKWLRWESNSELLVNQTSIAKSLASLDRFQWLDRHERAKLVDTYDMVSIEFSAVVHMERPGYLHVLPSCGAGSTAVRAMSKKKNPYQFLRNNPVVQDYYHYSSKGRSSSPYFDVDDCPVLPTDRLWVTGFSLAGRSGHIHSVEADSGEKKAVNPRTRASLLWPNEVVPVPLQIWRHNSQNNNNFNKNEPSCSTTVVADGSTRYQDALLVADGFLVPGKDRGGLYIVKHPGNPHAEWTLRLTQKSTLDHRWFYHRASWVDLTGDGRCSILTARCKVSTRFPSGRDRTTTDGIASGISKEGQLIWLECPQPHRVDAATGTPLEADGTMFDPFAAKHLPWKEHVLTEGPDVMFCLADMDPTDNTIEALCNEFFNKRVTLKSIRRGPKPQIVMERVLDDRCGAAFGCIPAYLDAGALSQSFPLVVDSGSTVPCLKAGDVFSHLLVTSHECTYAETENSSNKLDAGGGIDRHQAVATDQATADGGSLFAYRVPRGKDAWKTEPWIRITVATGFKVQGQLGNMINPGAPGFVYTFHAKEEKNTQKRPCSKRRPLIAVAGDCAESAYLFRPNTEVDGTSKNMDRATSYKLMAEIKCGATVGSIGVGYDDFLSFEQESGYAKLYIPCFEKDKILVFALGSGDDEKDDW